jgi:hypothetical protein
MHPFLTLILVVFFTFTPLSQAASIAQVELGNEQIESIKLARSVTLTLNGKSTLLRPFAAGLRKKKVALFWAKVYVIQFFASGESLANSPVSAISLTFKRDLTATQIREGFESSLKENNHNLESPSFKPLADALRALGNQKDGSTFWIALERHEDKETVMIENDRGALQTLVVTPGVSDQFLSIWWGKPSDSGMEVLKKELHLKRVTN